MKAQVDTLLKRLKRHEVLGCTTMLALILCPLTMSAQAPDTAWTRTFGGSYPECGYSVRQTLEGGYIIVGETYSYGPGTPSHSNIYLIKTNSSGYETWTKTYGGDYDDAGFSVLEQTSGLYVIASYRDTIGNGEKDVWLLFTNLSGDTIWTQT